MGNKSNRMTSVNTSKDCIRDKKREEKHIRRQRSNSNACFQSIRRGRACNRKQEKKRLTQLF